MPAQTKAGQIDVPVFRMLGSDPIYQHGTTPGLFSMEPVYPRAGGSSNWVAWFMNNLIHEPALAFGYVQAGQENSFGWKAMSKGLTLQVALFAAEAKAGHIQVETLAQTGEWFHQHFPLTPPTAVVALDDWKHRGRKTVWYDSRFYRANLLWQDGTVFFRDLHCFDENVVSPTHDTALTGRSLAYYTLPIVDTALASPSSNGPAGLWPVILSSGQPDSRVSTEGQPVVTELNATALSVQQPLNGGGALSIIFSESAVALTALDADGKPFAWACDLTMGTHRQPPEVTVTPDAVQYRYAGTSYQLRLPAGSGSCQRLANGDIRLTPNRAGKLSFVFDTHSL
jgi:hypothetical protein